jgi:hypothetical protein
MGGPRPAGQGGGGGGVAEREGADFIRYMTECGISSATQSAVRHGDMGQLTIDSV